MTNESEANLDALFGDELEDAVSEVGDPSTWAPSTQEWMQALSRTLSRVKASDGEARASREFQQMLWEENFVAAVGQGNISVQAALDDDGFREWVAQRSLDSLPGLPSDRIAFLARLYDELTSRLKAFVPNRTPHLKIFRVLAALYPDAMTTIADRGKLMTLADRLKVGRNNGAAGCHVLIRARLDPFVDSTGDDGAALATRMIIPWLLYKRYCEGDPEKRTEEPLRPGDKIRLHPLPAVQRLRGLSSIRELFPGMLAVLDFVGDGMGREELIVFLRTLAPESKVESLLAIATILQSQFDVLRREGDRYFRSERGENVVASRDPAALGDWLLTRVLGVDHVVAALHNGPRTTAELIALLRKVNPGWRTDFVPKVLLAWLRSLRATEADSARRVTLAEIGREWAEWIDWTPEPLPAEPNLDDLLEEATTADVSAPALQLPNPAGIIEAVRKTERFPVSQIASLHAGLWANHRRHFAILTGLSGSGKTRLAREYATALTGEDAACSLTVPVQPGWYDPGPLLGYTNPVKIDEYVCPPFLKFLLAAAENLGRPYVVVLDEMNLSHPEQYMAPLLSAMETGDWIHLHEKGDIFDEIPRVVRYPRNLVLIGTVNMDETTHGLSDKVLDRAFVQEFWEIDLALYPRWDRPQLDAGQKQHVRELLEAMMAALSPARLHFGWRVVDDILDYLAQTSAMVGILDFEQALDDVVYSKVLPKLRGEDSERLREALKGCQGALETFHLPRAKRKLDELRNDLKSTGSARFWR
jgi:MoxR-like ATPase